MELAAMPKEFQTRYDNIRNEYLSLQDDINKYKVSQLPRYVSVLRFLDEIGLTSDYAEMTDLAERATLKSYAKGVPVRSGYTHLGVLNCYLEEILEDCLDEMMLEDED